MIHARIDLVIMGHRRAYESGPEAMGLWLFAVGYAREQETDGFVPAAILHAAWGGKKNEKLAARLVDAGLLVRVDGGYTVAKYAAKNELKAQIDERRAWEAKRKAERRNRGTSAAVPAVSQWDTRGTPSGVRNTEPEPEPEPDHEIGSAVAPPSPPVLTLVPKVPKPKATKRAPADWQPKLETIEFLRAQGHSAQHIETCVAMVRDHEFRSPRTDWDATLRNWVRQQQSFGGAATGGIRGNPLLQRDPVTGPIYESEDF